MPLTILVAAAGSSDGLSAAEVAEHVARGALHAAPGCSVLRCLPDDAVITRGDLVLVAGTSALNSAIAWRAVELGVAAVVLAGSLRAAGGERHAAGLVMYEPDGHPDAIDSDLVAARLCQGAFHAVLGAFYDHPACTGVYVGASTMPAPTVSLLASSTRMNAPVARFTA